ncbi:hypothetical protein [Mitsuaria sp. TWR114]|jgi:serine/threonine-protein kinase HipA|uniref:hypothetical protein n=1 Tax=Mitsuaria sp. TWR114 TaxID=2601731 RepID=UPI00164AD8F1|nr:hypothetical protein [Mitsuaria sp. TWR114]
MTMDSGAYEPTDQLWLWWLGDPQTPRLIGELRLVRPLKGVSLTYSEAWLSGA